jgi:two-component system, chemotaxis family, CheB/CheR fusion protein
MDENDRGFVKEMEAISLQAETAAEDASAGKPRYVVGVGASAGGLEALEQFFENMPAKTGLAFVVVQHLSPDFRSLMDELLARRTEIPIRRVEDGMVVEPDTVYLLPPKKEMIVSGGRLLLTDKDPSQPLTLPIDHFFRSLAQEMGEGAIGIVLSGTGSDGSRGIRAIHEAGGLVLVQSAETAKFDGMPKSAVGTGVADFVVPVNEMPATLLRYIHHPLAEGMDQVRATGAQRETAMETIYRLLRDRYGIDFSHYKPNTVARRTERRLMLNQSLDLEDYVKRLEESPDELNLLYRDLLIGVTRFFRDHEAFERLEKDILPDALAAVGPDEEFRVWVAGCATGEEAYSLAILILERLEKIRRPVKVKIFATDVHRASLEFAGQGIYSEAAIAELAPDRLARHFVRKGDGYHVSQDLRQMVVFAQHNIIRDAPFTKLDLISCRNLVIYFQPLAQRKALSLFHFGLKTGGLLFLGPSESPGELADEFDHLDPHWKIYRKRRDIRLPAELRVPLSVVDARLRPTGVPPMPHLSQVDANLLGVYDVLLDDHMPPSLLVDENRALVQAFGGASRFLRVRDGRVSNDLLDMVDTDLRMALSGALQRVARSATPIVYKGLRVNPVDGQRLVNIVVQPIRNRRSSRLYALISLEEIAETARPDATEIDFRQASDEQLRSLESELSYTKENLQATIEELETSNEELQATNEELVASNEELQSTNEELHSVNEELYTVNAEYQKKIVELTELNADMDNLLASTEVHTVFLDRELTIRKFTPKIAALFNLLPQDIGRRIDIFVHHVRYERLMPELRRVLETAEPFEREVQDAQGRWFLLRILPYRSGATVSGVVLTFIDIGSLKQAEARAGQNERQLASILENSPTVVAVKDKQGRYLVANRAFRTSFGIGHSEIIGKTDYDIFPPELAGRLIHDDTMVLNTGSVVNSETALPHPEGARAYLSVKFPIRGETGELHSIGIVKTDVTQLKAAEFQAREAVVQRDRFLAILSHELRNPLSAILNASRLLQSKGTGRPAAADFCQVIDRQARHMARLLDDLLDVSRITQQKITIRKEPVDLAVLVEQAIDAAGPMIASHRHTLNFDRPADPLPMQGDPVRISQVVENLLTNAAKYTPDGGQISISLRRDGDRILLGVRDNGQGIPVKMLHSVFDLFVQSDNTLDRSEGGMGVGLTLVRSIVELHGGTITARSDGPGRGSEFLVSFPLASRLEPAPAPPTAAPRSSGVRVLIVEDNSDCREMLKDLLVLDGFDVAAAENGTAGLDALRRHRPDVAIIDIGLPGLDGYEVARQIRAAPENRGVRLIALTGYGRPEDHEKVMAAGFDNHLVKPILQIEVLHPLLTGRSL